MIKDFASFHNHSDFSMMDGISRPEEIVLAAKSKGLTSVALTDHGIMHGQADFYLAGKKHGVKTVYGVEAYVIHSIEEWRALKDSYDLSRRNKGKSESEDGEEINLDGADVNTKKKLNRKGHLVLLASNQVGLNNLYDLTYQAHKKGFYGKPRCDKAILAAHSEGVVASSACMGGVIANKCWEFQRGDCVWEDVVREACEFDSIFGRGRFFLELQFNEHDGQRYVNDCLVKVSKETGIPLTVTSDAHYIRPEDWEIQEVLYMLRSNKTLATRGDNWSFTVKQLYIKSAEEMWSSFEKFGGTLDAKTAIEAFKNTLLIDSLIENYEPDTHQRLPSLPFSNPFKEVGQRAIEGMKRLGLADNDVYKARMLHELKTIKEKGISNYFIIVQNIIAEAKKSMLVGAGRGSAAGSLVCYCLGITDLDPIEHTLMFERFLDPGRVELPDIDVDFEDADAAKDMLRRMFGEDNVACLSSYGTFQIKGLLKDLGRVYDIDHGLINLVNRKIEQELKKLYINQDKSTIVIRLEDIERISPSFVSFVDTYPEVGRLIKHLYGRNRHVSRHACGVIIGDNLSKETAVFTSKGVVQASFTEGIINKNISAMGFVKFDILSIATLKVINRTIQLLGEKNAEGLNYEQWKERIRPHNLNLNDLKVMKNVFWDGNFAGVFQFTESGIRRLAMRVKPESFDDISAITSLYRPGPLASKMDDLFVHNKINPDSIVYEHPLLESILKRTRGTLVYQEQLMDICRILGKMSMKDVNRVRKQLLKKDKSKTEEYLKKEHDELSTKFFIGCEENNLDKSKAEEIWKRLLAFGAYGFNAAHSYAYSVMTMQSAYLATYHPLEFYSSVLTLSQSAGLQNNVRDIRKKGIKILPVDINKSKFEHTIEDGDIRLSFKSALGVGPSAIEKIVENQPFKNFIDYIDRAGVGKTATEPLIKIGAFNSIYEPEVDLSGPNMRKLHERYTLYLENPKYKTKKCREEFLQQYYNISQDTKDYDLGDKMTFENELMGFSLLGGPFEIKDREEKINVVFGDSIIDYKEFIESEDMELAAIPVSIKEVKERPQRNGQIMAFVKFLARSGEEFEAPAFGAIWKHIRTKCKPGAACIVVFNRKEEDPQRLIIGKPGFAHSVSSATSYVIDIDEITL